MNDTWSAVESLTIVNLVLCFRLEITNGKASLSYVLQNILLDYGPLH